MTVLHAGGKFEKGAYKISGGLHGVGSSVVNALSAWMYAEVHKDGKVYAQTYKRGVPQDEVHVIGETDKRGTTIAFTPDTTIFETDEFSYTTISTRLKHAAYLTPGVVFTVVDEVKGRAERFYFE